MSTRTGLACCISKIWQHSSWTKRWNLLTLQLVSGNQHHLGVPWARWLSWRAEAPGRGTAGQPCQLMPARRTAVVRPADEVAVLLTHAPAVVTQGSDFDFSIFLAVSGMSDILTILLTSTGDAEALLCTKAGSMCLKTRLQNSASFKTRSFQRLLASSLVAKIIFARA